MTDYSVGNTSSGQMPNSDAEDKHTLELADYTRSRLQMRFLEHTILPPKQAAWTEGATLHLTQGFNRRLLMIEAGHRFVCQTGARAGQAPLSPYEVTDLAIHINAFYLNMVGALDNLGWAIKHELMIMPEVTEFTRGRHKIGLFAGPMLVATARSSPGLASLLSEHAQWYKGLRELRDPAAHRIPIYPMPGVLDEAALAEAQRLRAEGEAQLAEARRLRLKGNTRAATDKLTEGLGLLHHASRVGSYQPWISLPTATGHDVWDMVRQSTADYDALLSISHGVLKAVFALPR